MQNLLPQLLPAVRFMRVLLPRTEIRRQKIIALWMVPSCMLVVLGSDQTSVHIMQSQQLYIQPHMLSKFVSWSYILVNSWAKIVLTLSIWVSDLFFISILLFLHTRISFLSRLVLPPMSWQSWTFLRKILQQLTGKSLWKLFKSLLNKLPNLRA